MVGDDSVPEIHVWQWRYGCMMVVSFGMVTHDDGAPKEQTYGGGIYWQGLQPCLVCAPDAAPVEGLAGHSEMQMGRSGQQREICAGNITPLSYGLRAAVLVTGLLRPP